MSICEKIMLGRKHMLADAQARPTERHGYLPSVSHLASAATELRRPAVVYWQRPWHVERRRTESLARSAYRSPSPN